MHTRMYIGLKVKGQLVRKMEWKQTDGRTRPIALPPLLTCWASRLPRRRIRAVSCPAITSIQSFTQCSLPVRLSGTCSVVDQPSGRRQSPGDRRIRSAVQSKRPADDTKYSSEYDDDDIAPASSLASHTNSYNHARYYYYYYYLSLTVSSVR